MALLLLRFSEASLAAVMIRLFFLPHWLSVCAAILAVALLAGVITPLAAALGAVLVMSYFFGHHDNMLDIVVLLHAAVAIAIALLGPGAYSVDAYLFGRRVIKF